MPLPQVYPPCRPMEKKRQRFRDAPTQAKNWLRSPALQASRQRLLGQEPALLSRLSCTSRTATSIRSRRARSGACSSRPTGQTNSQPQHSTIRSATRRGRRRAAVVPSAYRAAAEAAPAHCLRRPAGWLQTSCRCADRAPHRI